jgi:hypothetical protein
MELTLRPKNIFALQEHRTKLQISSSQGSPTIDRITNYNQIKALGPAIDLHSLQCVR